jgi:hypothetical protein
MYRFSQWLAWTAGLVLPLVETLRRWGTWWDMPAAYLDDVVIGDLKSTPPALLFVELGEDWIAREKSTKPARDDIGVTRRAPS